MTNEEYPEFDPELAGEVFATLEDKWAKLLASKVFDDVDKSKKEDQK